jgi:hypothetical protein
MTPTSVVGGAGGRERIGVIGLAALVVVSVAAYLAVKSSVLEVATTGRLLPYQALAQTLTSADKTMYQELLARYLELEQFRIRTGKWPETAVLAARPPYTWTRSEEALFVNYLATPSTEVSESAWLIVAQEPDPRAPPDPAPNDETHRRLADGTILHVTFWTHRFGGQIAPGFIRQPETKGWTQVLTAPVPVAPVGK